MLVQLLLQKDGGAQTSTVPQGGGNDAESPLPWEGFGLRIYLKQILHRCEAGGAGWGFLPKKNFSFLNEHGLSGKKMCHVGESSARCSLSRS